METIGGREVSELYKLESKFYDAVWGKRPKEVSFYSGLISGYGKKVLELGVGTAALALPLALEGYEVTGIDNSSEMLAMADRKALGFDESIRQRLTLISADMRSFDLAEKGFDFAFIAFNTFLHLLSHEDQLNCLNCIGRHLRPRGGLVVDVFQLDPRRPEGVLRLDFTIKSPQTGAEVIKYYQQYMDYAQQVMDIYNVYNINEVGTSRTYTTRYRLRIILRGELELLLDKAGFEVINVFGSFDKEPQGTASKKIIMMAEKR